VLLGRGDELGRLRDLSMDAREGAGRALVLSGDPGIGKTALLEASANAANGDGLRVLRTRGARSEATLPFAGLSALLRPIASRIAELPLAQAALLGGALGFAEVAPADPFAVAAAALNLLGLVSTEQPILLVCDDAHWLDPASLGSFLFIAGRLTEQAISVVLSTRPEGVGGELARLETFELAGLDEDSARALLSERFGERLAPEVAAALIAATAGNPLALLEIPEVLSGRQLLGLDPLVSPLPVGEATSAAYRQRIAELPDETRRALVVAAASDQDDAVVVRRAFEVLQIPSDALAPAEDAGLVQLDGARIEFRHALVRSVAHHDAKVSERRAAHHALAEALGSDDPRSAWHLAAASTGPDELVAGALEGAAMAAMTRSGFGEASIALSRAAELSTDPDGRFRRRLGAARTAFFAGDIARAQTLTAEALRAAPDPRSLALAQQLRGRVDIWWPLRPMRETGVRLVGESLAIEAIDTDIAIAMLFDAVFAFIAGGNVTEARAPAAHAVALAQDAQDRALLAEVEAIHGWVEVLTGINVGAIEKMIRVRDQIDRTRPEAAQLSMFLDVPLQLMGAHDEFLAVLAAGIEGARGAAALMPLATLLSLRAEGEMHIGRWQLAEIDALEALSLSPPGFAISAYANAILARLDALKGNADACRARAHETLRQSAVGQEGVSITFARVALATLEQTLGNHQRAFELFVENAAAEERLGLRNPLITNTLLGIVETGVLIGQHDIASRHQASLEAAAAALDAPSLHAFAAHGRGLLATGDAYRDAFEEALEWHERGGRRFDRARTQLGYGERLRRDRHRVESRRLLRAAIESFDEVGSAPWSERARRELQATGETTHPRVESSRELLTPQELQVARLAAEGLSNNEIAARLFISPRTVEKHLGQALRKLDVSSRRGLILAGSTLLGA
jgi:DNA-binding CsgD family transcriptional regulator